MLPFLARKRQDSGGMITITRKPDSEEKASESADLTGLEVAMEDLSKAHEMKDYKAMARAFKAAFDMLESAPQDEYPHDETESE